MHKNLEKDVKEEATVKKKSTYHQLIPIQKRKIAPLDVFRLENIRIAVEI